jgi:hypothetical protein
LWDERRNEQVTALLYAGECCWRDSSDSVTQTWKESAHEKIVKKERGVTSVSLKKDSCV